jgi:hypothetical protein
MRRRFILAATGAGLLIMLLAALAIAGAWPFDAGSSDAGSGRHVLWEKDVELQEKGLYALDILPVEPHGPCVRCIVVQSDAQGQATLSAGNGIQGWPSTGEPSYFDCIILRNKLTLDSVALDAPRSTLGAVALHGWICATGGGDDGLIRMQYNGRKGGRFLFSVTSWGRPAEG